MLHPTLSPPRAFYGKVDTGFPQKMRSNKESRAPSDSTQLESALEAFPGSLIPIVVLDSGLIAAPVIGPRLARTRWRAGVLALRYRHPVKFIEAFMAIPSDCRQFTLLVRHCFIWALAAIILELSKHGGHQRRRTSSSSRNALGF